MIGVPTVLLGSSGAAFVHEVVEAVRNHSISIGQPDPSVAQWPLVGQKVFDLWSEAANGFPALIERIEPQLGTISKYILGVVASSAAGILQFLGFLIIAGIVMACLWGGGKQGALADHGAPRRRRRRRGSAVSRRQRSARSPWG